MKVAIISPYLSSVKDSKYYQSQQINLARELINCGIDVDIITAKRSSLDADFSIIDDINIIRLNTTFKWTEKYFNLLIMSGLWRILKSNPYDYIQASDDCSPATFLSACFCLFNSSVKPKLVIYQGIYQYSANKYKKVLMKLYDFLTVPITKRGTCFVACKTTKAASFLSQKGFNKLEVVPVGVNLNIFYPEKKAPSNNIELLAVGNLIDLKNFPLVIKSFQLFYCTNSSARLTIIGSGPEKEYLLLLARNLGLNESNFRILENIANCDMRKYYTQSDLLLLFSKSEIFGMVILEAMACGCPVLSSATPGAQDVIRNGINGFIVDKLEEESIAAQLNIIFSNKELLFSVRNKSILLARSNYSWQCIAERYVALYHKYLTTDTITAK